MRLRQLRDLLESTLPISVSVTDRGGNPRTYTLQNIKSLQQDIKNLTQSKLFSERIIALKELSFYQTESDNLIIPDSEFRILQSEATLLNELMEAMIDALSQSIPKDNPDIISIKIPTPNSFKDLIETTGSLDKIFSQTLYHDDIKGSFTISNFDTGSYWIDILIGGGASALHFVAALAWGSAVVYKKIQEGRLLKEQVEEYKLSNAAKKEINDKSKAKVNSVAEVEAEFLYNKFYNGHTPEQISRIKLALMELAELYSKGAEIYPSIEADPDTAKEFPSMKAISSIKSKIESLPPKK